MTAALVREIITLLPTTPTSRVLVNLVTTAMREHESTFTCVERTIVSSGNIGEAYTKIGKEIFADGVVHWGRIVMTLALAVHLQQKLGIDLEKETSRVFDENAAIVQWLYVQGGWDDAASGIFYGCGDRLGFVNYMVDLVSLTLFLETIKLFNTNSLTNSSLNTVL